MTDKIIIPWLISFTHLRDVMLIIACSVDERLMNVTTIIFWSCSVFRYLLSELTVMIIAFQYNFVCVRNTVVLWASAYWEQSVSRRWWQHTHVVIYGVITKMITEQPKSFVTRGGGIETTLWKSVFVVCVMFVVWRSQDSR